MNKLYSNCVMLNIILDLVVKLFRKKNIDASSYVIDVYNLGNFYLQFNNIENLLTALTNFTRIDANILWEKIEPLLNNNLYDKLVQTIFSQFRYQEEYSNVVSYFLIHGHDLTKLEFIERISHRIIDHRSIFSIGYMLSFRTSFKLIDILFKKLDDNKINELNMFLDISKIVSSINEEINDRIYIKMVKTFIASFDEFNIYIKIWLFLFLRQHILPKKIF